MLITIETTTFIRFHMTVNVSIVGTTRGYYVIVEMTVGETTALVDSIPYDGYAFADVCNDIDGAHLATWLKIAHEEGLIP